MQKNANHVEFVYRVCADPANGFTEAKEFIEDDVPDVMAEYPGKKVCFADAAGSQVSFAQYGSYANYQLITLDPVDFADYK